MKKTNVRWIAESAILAALYVALTWLLAPISYGAIQFRLSEILLLLVVLNPKYAYALIIGCFVANTTSAFGWYDMLFGTLATILAILPMIKIKKLSLACLFPVISNALIISLELCLYFKEPAVFGYNALTIALGEAVVLYLFGIPVMTVLAKNETIVALLELDTSMMPTNKWLTASKCFNLIVGITGLLFYVAYPIQNQADAFHSALALTMDYPWLSILAGLSLASLIVGLFLPRLPRLIFKLLIGFGYLTVYILVSVYVEQATQTAYYYGYLLYLLFYFIWLGYDFLKKQECEQGYGSN